MRLPRTWRPLGVRLAGALFGTMLLVVVLAAWFLWDDEIRAKFTFLQKATVIAIGGLFFAAGFALARSRVVAREEGLVVVNGYRRREYEWPELVAVNLPPGAPWVTLDLADGTTVSAMGIQGSDGARARTAVRELRAVLSDRSTPG